MVDPTVPAMSADFEPGFSDLESLLSKYDYDLPAEAIAQIPAEPRDASRLLVIDRRRDSLTDARFSEIARFLAPGDLLVLNDTRVVPARLMGRRIPSGGRAQILLVSPRGDGRWEAMLRASGRLRAGQRIDIGAGFEAVLTAPRETPLWEIALSGPGDIAAHLEMIGHIPLPPYIRRPDDRRDREWYQTIFARNRGAVAAPTAGLHFTQRVFDDLRQNGIEIAHLTLHVGPGTFCPLSGAELQAGHLHAERFVLPAETALAIAGARARSSRVVAVGTTSARVLESCATEGRQALAMSGETRLFIHPPYEPKVVDVLLTNFHLPRTSLLMLVAAFAGRERVLRAYRTALERGYRFYSYGDAMLII